ncbi:Protein-L-isoaspartate O-methyltransferase [hydrothermal vent metagenome]|uniref:protein-L-isoaspartate(D-aspartate) O-methyltransferase n=1 Tax=hydrothermal vent metagenome TaxID=652676 RepID=A0A3B0TMN2_9ZZZZ
MAEPRVIELIMSLRNAGIRDTKVLAAIERVPRNKFVDAAQAGAAYADRALPIDCGQTISQPYIVAYMTEQLRLDPMNKVLEIGTGSGYQTAVLAQLCRRVYTIERYRTLLRQAERRFADLGLTNITAMVGDGTRGWGAQAPFDRIIVTAAAPERPLELIGQLNTGGHLIAPIESGGGEQHLVRYTKTGTAFSEEKLLAVRFVPLLSGIAKQD